MFPDVRIEILTSWDGESWDKISVRKKIHAARKLLLSMDTALISPDPEARAALRLASQVTDVNVFLDINNVKKQKVYFGLFSNFGHFRCCVSLLLLFL